MLAYTDHGGSGVPVLLLHAFPLDSALWDDVLAELPAGVRAITVDLPGLGASAVPAQDPGVAVCVRGVLDVLDACGVLDAVLVGISTGGYVAAALVEVAPERVRALLLASTTSRVMAPDDPDQRRATATELDRSGTVAAVLGSADEGLGATAHRERPELVTRVRAMIGRQDPAGVAWIARAVAVRSDTSAAVRALDAPVLLLFGDEDVATPLERAHELAALRPDADVVILPKTGHLTPLERPAGVAHAIARLANGA